MFYFFDFVYYYEMKTDPADAEFSQRNREILLAQNLSAKLNLISARLTQDDSNPLSEISCEANELIKEIRGRELLYLIGRIYLTKSSQ